MTLGLVEPGSIIKRVYYAVPQHYDGGDEYPTFLAAVRAAQERADGIKERVKASYTTGVFTEERIEEIAEECAKTACVVDLRWVIEGPRIDEFTRGPGLDTIIERKNVRHLSADHCDRMEAMQRGIARR